MCGASPAPYILSTPPSNSSLFHPFPLHMLPSLSLFPVTFCSFSHSSNVWLPSSSFPMTVNVVWIPSWVVRGLQADTTPPYMNGMHEDQWWYKADFPSFPHYNPSNTRWAITVPFWTNLLSGEQQEAIQHTQGLEKDIKGYGASLSKSCGNELNTEIINHSSYQIDMSFLLNVVFFHLYIQPPLQ